MMRIADVMDRDFSRPIEEIIKVNNQDEETVYTELTEYVATPRIQEEYERLFHAMTDAPSSPNEGIGVWISGFFGSGKSSFAKNLGYVLSNRIVCQIPASDLFLKQVNSRRIEEYLRLLNQTIPYEVFMFDVQVDLSVQTSTEQIAEVMYRVLLRSLDYAEDYDIAELEIELEAEKKLSDFEELCRETYGDWRQVRKGSQKYTRASTLLHDLDRRTYPTATTWLEMIKSRPYRQLTVKDLVERSFELCARRRPGRAFAFVIDELGQYVARSGERLENLRAVVEQFGRASLERLKARTIPGPVWVIVTSQEKLQDVFNDNYLSSGRIDLPKLQDRFKFQVDLSPADIREVATRRVLRKKEDRKEELRKLYRTHGPSLVQNIKLERSSRETDFDEDEFVQFYPYLPHLVDLSIDVMTGIRNQPHVPKHLGGSNRTIIKQSFEMLVSPRTRMAEQPLGALVSLDRVYELVEGNISSEKQKDIEDIRKNFDRDADFPGMASRVAKALCLMEFVTKDLPRTPRNIAALLIQRVDEPPPIPAVEAILHRLKEAQFVRETEGGWKLQTAQEKQWEQEKRQHARPTRTDQLEILRNALRDVLGNAKASRLQYRGICPFSLEFSLDGQPVTAPQKGASIPFRLFPVPDEGDFGATCQSLSTESLQPSRQNEIIWAFPISQQTERIVEDLHASRRMVAKYQHTVSMQQLRGGERALLDAEKTQQERLEAQLHAALGKDLLNGAGFFRGIRKEPGDYGSEVGQVFRAIAEEAVPALYPKLELGARPLDGKEVEKALKETNLGALPEIFFPGEKGLGLVVKEGAKFVLNTKAPVAQEILDYLRNRHSYGEKVSGANLLDTFGGIGYGWPADVVRLVVAVLFRAGSLEVTHQGRRYRSYQEPDSRNAFLTIPSFRSAGFSPRESIDLKTLTRAVQELESLLGREVDVEESVIANELRTLAREEREQTLPALAQAKALELPLERPLKEWLETLDAILSSQSDDCVRTLAGEGKSLSRSLKNRLC